MPGKGAFSQQTSSEGSGSEAEGSLGAWQQRHRLPCRYGCPADDRARRGTASLDRPDAFHGCGHDGHTPTLLGAAKYLSEHPDFAGTVYFIFQPAGETLRGGPAMIADGLFTFRDGHKPYMIRRIVERVAQASQSESETLNAGALLTSFSGLRRAGEIVAMEWRKMNLPVNFEDSPLMKESYDRVRVETDANRLIAVITETLQRKFPNDVPSDLNVRLTALSVDELDAMFTRSIDANSADAILLLPRPL